MSARRFLKSIAKGEKDNTLPLDSPPAEDDPQGGGTAPEAGVGDDVGDMSPSDDDLPAINVNKVNGVADIVKSEGTEGEEDGEVPSAQGDEGFESFLEKAEGEEEGGGEEDLMSLFTDDSIAIDAVGPWDDLLKEIDINDLLQDCQEVAELLKVRFPTAEVGGSRDAEEVGEEEGTGSEESKDL